MNLIYEDDLNMDIPESLYARWFQLSEIVDGVRMGPEVKFNDRLGWYIVSDAAELRRREQAQHTPGPVVDTTVSDLQQALAESYSTIDFIRKEMRWKDDNLAELAAENERLRGMLAECVDALEAIQQGFVDKSIQLIKKRWKEATK